MKHSNTSPAMAQVDTIYRAKKIDGDGWVGADKLAYGAYVKFARNKMSGNMRVGHFIYDDKKDNGCFNTFEIDPSTISIHFTNSGMNDSEGTPIFASLSEDGNGGDAIEDEVVLFSSLTNSVVIVEKPYIGQYDMYQGVYKPYFNSFKVTGIHTVKEES